jgi:hypothetical protein
MIIIIRAMPASMIGELLSINTAVRLRVIPAQWELPVTSPRFGELVFPMTGYLGHPPSGRRALGQGLAVGLAAAETWGGVQAATRLLNLCPLI